jgi:hypothetical protein
VPRSPGANLSAGGFRLSLAAYLVCVVMTTALGFGVMMLFRPSLTHSVRQLFALEPHLEATSNSFYTIRVAPVLEEHCVSCHGKDRQKAKLRLDSYAAILRGGKHGPVIKRGDLRDSELYSRITSPLSSDKTMPPSSKPPIPAGDVTIIRLWIAGGASGVQPATQIKGAPPPVSKVRFLEVDEAAVEKARAGRTQLVRRLQQQYPGVINYESRMSANLELNASLMGTAFGNADLKEFASVSDHIVWADLSGTALSDGAIELILAMVNLRVLRANDLRLTSSTLVALGALKALRSLTVVGTPIAAESVTELRAKGIKIYDGSDS